jgi:hypothetical protein
MILVTAENLVAIMLELRQQGKDTNKNIKPLVEKLEYWFGQHPKGFPKHCEPRKDQDNLDGLSWTQELLISKPTFKKAFKEIGVCYLSPQQYEQAEDKFQGKFYCSVLHLSNNHRTFYYCNTELIATVRKKWFDGIERKKWFDEIKLMVKHNTQNLGLDR